MGHFIPGSNYFKNPQISHICKRVEYDDYIQASIFFKKKQAINSKGSNRAEHAQLECIAYVDARGRQVRDVRQ